jgi:hypothetical protein
MGIYKGTTGWKKLVTCALLILYTTLIWSIQGKDSELTMIGTQSVGRESMEIHLKWRGIKWEIICL